MLMDIETVLKGEGIDDPLVEGSYEYLKIEILELKQILVALTTKYKVSEDKRKVMEKRVENLLHDNKTLREQCAEAEKRKTVSEKEASRLQERVVKLRRALAKTDSVGTEEAEEVLGQVAAGTSCTDFPPACPNEEAWPRSQAKGKKAKKKPMKCLQEDVERVVLSKQELVDLDEGMRDLRQALTKREEAWSRTCERERNQRLRINHLSSEMRNLKNQHNWKASELEYKSRELKSKIQELASAKKDITNLKAALMNSKPFKEFRSRKALAPENSLLKSKRTKSQESRVQADKTKIKIISLSDESNGRPDS